VAINRSSLLVAALVGDQRSGIAAGALVIMLLSFGQVR
jgi:hypothetical protein